MYTDRAFHPGGFCVIVLMLSLMMWAGLLIWAFA